MIHFVSSQLEPFELLSHPNFSCVYLHVHNDTSHVKVYALYNYASQLCLSNHGSQEITAHEYTLQKVRMTE